MSDINVKIEEVTINVEINNEPEIKVISFNEQWPAWISWKMVWTIITSDQSLNPWYYWHFTNWASKIILTLPPTAIIWDIVRISTKNLVGWRIGQNALQSIKIWDKSTTIWIWGYLENTDIWDTIELVCETNLIWRLVSMQGNIIYI